MKKLLLLGAVTLFATASLQATPTVAEEKELLQSCLAPQEISETLDGFFQDSDVKNLLSLRKPIRLQGHWPSKMKPAVQASFKTYAQDMNAKSVLRQKYLANLQEKGVTLLPSQSSYIFANVVPGFVLKIPAVNYPTYPKICEYISTADTWDVIEKAVTPYQMVSRVFSTKKIQDFVEAEGLNHIRVLQKLLYPLATFDADSNDGIELDGIIYPHVNDTNYIVVAEQIPNFTPDTPVATIKDFKTMLEGIEVKPEYEALMAEIIQVITYAGIWSLKGAFNLNIFLIEEDGIKKAVFVDLEKPGLGGSEDPTFFHKNPAEVMRNAACGFDELCDLLKK